MRRVTFYSWMRWLCWAFRVGRWCRRCCLVIYAKNFGFFFKDYVMEGFRDEWKVENYMVVKKSWPLALWFSCLLQLSIFKFFIFCSSTIFELFIFNFSAIYFHPAIFSKFNLILKSNTHTLICFIYLLYLVYI